MKIISVLCILIFAVVGCGRFGGGAGSGANNAAASTPRSVEKAVDIPGLFDKSHEEINKVVGQDSKVSVGTASWELSKGTLHIVYSKDKKPGMITYKVRTQDLGGGMSSSGYVTAEELGRAVGLDLKDKTPSPSSKYTDKYYDFMINGKKCEVSVSKLLESYNEISVMLPAVL